MNEFCSNRQCSFCEIPGCECVYFCGGIIIAFRLVNVRIGSTVDNYVYRVILDKIFNRFLIRNIESYNAVALAFNNVRIEIDIISPVVLNHNFVNPVPYAPSKLSVSSRYQYVHIKGLLMSLFCSCPYRIK